MWVVAGGGLVCLSSVPQVVTAVRTARIRAHRSGLWVFSPWISYCAGLARSPPTHSSLATPPTTPTPLWAPSIEGGGAKPGIHVEFENRMADLRPNYLFGPLEVYRLSYHSQVSFCVSGSGCLDCNLSNWRHLRKTLNGNTDFTHEIQSLPMWGEAFLNF